jgi:hypothetical protein
MYKAVLALFVSLTIFAAAFNQDFGGKGIAMAYPNTADLEAVNASWWHQWGKCPDDTRCVPMTWGGEDPQLPVDYSGYVLFLNEPENPAQANISVRDAIQLYVNYTAQYPQAKWVIGNSLFWGDWAQWLVDFKALCAVTDGCIAPEYWGVHVYMRCGTGYEADCMAFVNGNLTYLHATLGGTFWVTEFAEIKGNLKLDKMMVDYFNRTNWIARYAYFTNKSMPSDPWVQAGWTVDLFDWDTGEMTAIGRWYRGPTNWAYLPRVNK